MAELFVVLLALCIFTGALCGFLAMSRIGALTRRISQLERQLESRPDHWPTPRRASAQPDRPAAATDTARPEQAADARPRPATPVAAQPQEPPRRRAPSLESRLQAHLRQHWMIWLGGFCVAMAGIYLARYSIEKGLLGPGARIALGLLTGAALHAGAEWLRRRMHGPHPAFAALAGGGSITLFAVLLASMRIYGLLSPATTFLLLALVAMLTMWLAYLHGPALAAIGMIGAYLVPIMVSSGEGRILVAMGYALVVSSSALLLMRYVYRPWLWWGFAIGVLAWWLLSLDFSQADPYRGYYLAAAAYLALALPDLDWLLRKPVTLQGDRLRLASFRTLTPHREKMNAIFVVLLIIAQCISMQEVASLQLAFWLWSPLPVLLLLAARRRENLALAPGLVLLATCAAWILTRVHHRELQIFPGQEARQFLVYLAATAAVYVALALRNLGSCRFKGIWSSLAALAPLILMALGYLLTRHDQVSWLWGLSALIAGLAYLALAGAVLRKHTTDTLVVWLFFGGHFALSLAAVALLGEARLTLAIAAQSISAAWIIDRFRLPQLGWVLKLIVTIVIVRLTLNPWLVSYPPGEHWSLWAYGGATACTFIAALMLRPQPQLARWAEGATLHLFVLTCWAELRYWLHDGAVFAARVDFIECAIYITLFGLLGVVYYRRSLASDNLAWLYRRYAYALSVLGAGSYGCLLVAVMHSSPWVTGAVSGTPVLNATQLAFGIPVLVGLAYVWFFEQRFRQLALGFTGLAFFVYASLQVRHLFQGSISLEAEPSNAELYTYSALWLLMAFAAILGGAWRLGTNTYRAGMLLLALVIAKLFLIDMGGLEGLYRVASFMGLGIALLGISFLHQRIRQAQGQG